MNNEIKTKWVAALRSGDYQQGSHELHGTDSNTFCCLGVLCDLAVLEDAVTKTDYNLTSYYGKEDENSHLPREVTEWAGLDSGNPEMKLHAIERSLTNLNDLLKLNFNQIANLIESQL